MVFLQKISLTTNHLHHSCILSYLYRKSGWNSFRMNGPLANMDGLTTEQKLIEEIGQGNLSAFGKLYDRYAPILFGVILKIVDDKEVAEDVLQKSFFQIREGIKNGAASFPSPNRILYWMLDVARSTAQEVNAQKSMSPAYTAATTQSVAPDNLVYGKNTVLRNNEVGTVAYSTTPMQKREKAIDLIFFKGYSLVQAAETLGISIAALKQQLRAELKNSRGVQ